MSRSFFLSMTLVAAAIGCGAGAEKAVTEAYESYRAAVAAEDLDALRGLLAKEKAASLDAPEAGMMLEMVAKMAPETAEVAAVEVEGSSAKILLEASMEGGTMKGTVSLVKEGGAWKVLGEDWQISMGGGGDLTERLRSGEPPRRTTSWKAHAGAVSCVAFTPGGDRIVTMSYDDEQLKLWDRTTGDEIGRARTKHRPTDMAMLPDGSRIAVADAYGNVNLWPIEVDGFGEPTPLGGNAGRNPVRIAVNGDGTLLVTSGFENPMLLWSVREGRQLEALPESAAQRGVAFSPKEGLVAGGGYGNTFTLWSLKAGVFGGRKEITIPKVTAQSDCWTVAFSPDGKRIVTGHMDSSITLWDVHRRKQIHNFFMQDVSVHDVAWSPDGTLFATAMQNGRVYLWNAEQGVDVAVLTGHGGAARSVAWSPAEWGLLATGDEKGEVYLWE